MKPPNKRIFYEVYERIRPHDMYSLLYNTVVLPIPVNIDIP